MQRNQRATDDPWSGQGRPRSPVERGLERTDAAARSAETTLAERVTRGTDRGVRWVVKVLAALLWAPLGLVFWLPFLLRRTVGYLFAVLLAGLTGGETRDAERRWGQAVAFYQLGFRRIVFAFRTDEDSPDTDPSAGEMRRQGTTRFALELAWASVVWVAVLWLTGLWPDAPADLRSGALRAWDVGVAAGTRAGLWLMELLPR